MNFDWLRVIEPNGQSLRPQELDRFQKNIGFELPEDYRNFLLRFNGGSVVIPHNISLPDAPLQFGVNCFLPLTAPSPSLGLVEARDIQVRHRKCLRQAIEIADDGGTGFYYLILAGEKGGAAYFVWKDDVPLLSPGEWEAWEVNIPACMIEVSPDFDSLGQSILNSPSLGDAEV